MNQLLRLYFVGLCVLCIGPVLAQLNQEKEEQESISVFSFDFSLAGQTPAGDLAERFGDNGSLGFGIQYKTVSQWIFGLEGAFLFGNNVKEPVAIGIRNSDGFIIDREGNFVNLLVLERGMTITASAGRLFPIFGPNKNSGIVVKLGGGFIEHRIRLEARLNEVPQIEGDYAKGYDRLTNGATIFQFIGYRNFSDNRLLNFTLGIEGYQGFTQNRRAFDFDLGRKDDEKRLDVLVGVRLTWSLPLYSKDSKDYYYQ